MGGIGKGIKEIIMQNISTFQQQFALSSKKFWKKMVEKFIMLGVVAVIVSVLFGTIFASLAVYLSDSSGSHWSPFAIIATVIFVFVAVYVITVVLYAMYVSAYIKRYYYDANNDFVTIKKNVFTPTEIHIQYQKIQDVYVDQDLLDRLFGIYDVHIASATVSSGIEAHIDGVDPAVAEGLKNFILDKIRNAGSVSGSGQSQPLNTTNPTIKAELSEEVSSNTYPINSRWYVQSVFTNIWAAAVATFLIEFFFFGGRSGGATEAMLKTAIGQSASSAAMILVPVGLWVIIFMGLCIASIVWKSNFHFAFQPEFVLQKEGVITRSERHLPYKSIQDVTLRQGIIERILGLSTVVIENAAQSGVVSRRGNISKQNNIRIPGQERAKGEALVATLNNIVRSSNSSGMGV